jgi:hypothetical protein
MRGLSPLWLALIAVGLLALASRSTLRELARRADVRWWGVVVGVFVAFAVAWVLAAGGNAVAGYPYPPSASTGYLWGQAFGSTWMWLEQLIGTVGLIPTNSLTGTRLPIFMLVLWLVALSGLVVVAWPAGSRRHRLVQTALVIAYLAIPVVLTVAEDRSVGKIWQGRYILPLAVGVPFMAAAMIAGRRAYGRPWLDRAAFVGAALLGLGEIFMFLANLRRFMVGVEGPINFLHGPWQPPVPAVLLAVVGVVAPLCLIAVLGALTARSRTTAMMLPRRLPDEIEMQR